MSNASDEVGIGVAMIENPRLRLALAVIVIAWCTGSRAVGIPPIGSEVAQPCGVVDAFSIYWPSSDKAQYNQ
jgi:hypothetical protein